MRVSLPHPPAPSADFNLCPFTVMNSSFPQALSTSHERLNPGVVLGPPNSVHANHLVPASAQVFP